MMTQVEKQKQLAEYSASLKEKTLEELKAMEQEIIKEADENDKIIKNTEFDLPAENYNVVAEAIRLLLEKETVSWQFALGVVSMYDFWDPKKRPATVLYPMLDGTLRTLGNQQFKGYAEWAAVVAINKYFEPIREKYVNTTEIIYDIAAKHNAILDEIKIKTPVEEQSKDPNDPNFVPDSIQINS